MTIIEDMPKLESLFVREIDEKGEYTATNKITPGYEWVLESEDVVCMEKLDGTNVSIIIQEGNIVAVFNRTTRIPFFTRGSRFIIDGVQNSYDEGRCELLDGQHFGELIGPKVQGNPYKVDKNYWLPFKSWGMKHLVYNSFHKYPKDFESLKKWLLSDISEGGIFSLYMKKRGIDQKPEGVVFHNTKTGEMCKLRLDMFKEYKGRRHKE